MKILTDAAGRVCYFGQVDPVPSAGQVVKDLPLEMSDYQAADMAGKATSQPYDVVLDAGKLVAKARAKTQAELDDDDRRDVIQKIDAALANWATLSAAQKDTALKTLLRGVRYVLR